MFTPPNPTVTLTVYPTVESPSSTSTITTAPTGTLTVYPTVIDWGTVTINNPVTRTVTVTSTQNFTLTAIALTNPTPQNLLNYASITISPPDGVTAYTPKNCTLTLTIHNGAPEGYFTTDIRLTCIS